MTGCSFVDIVNKLEEFDEFIKARKIVNVSILKMQLEALQGQSSNGKKPQFKKNERMLSSGIRAPRLDQDFRTDPPTHPPTRIFKTLVLSITLLSTNPAPDPTTQTYLYHLSKIFNQIFKLDLDFLLIQD